MMRESLHLAINMEPDLRVLDTNVESKSPLQLALPNGHDLIFLEQEPDVVLMALGNPGEDDLDAIALLRQAFPKTRIIAFITDEVSRQAERALARGAQKVLSKSTSRAELLGAIRTITRDMLVINKNHLPKFVS